MLSPFFYPILIYQAAPQRAPILYVAKERASGLALVIDGKHYPIDGKFDASNVYFYRVETSEFTTIQHVYFWGVLEYPSKENEHGKYFALEEYHLEIDPRRPNTKVDQPNYWAFWGSRSEHGKAIDFTISKIWGMPKFQQPQIVRFTLVK